MYLKKNTIQSYEYEYIKLSTNSILNISINAEQYTHEPINTLKSEFFIHSDRQQIRIIKFIILFYSEMILTHERFTAMLHK